MKISLKLANGAILDFEGDEKEFERLAGFLADPPDSLAAAAGATTQPPTVDEGRNDQAAGLVALDPANVAARFQELEPRNDQERVAIIAHLAVESGKEGVDFPTLTSLYRELGLQTPAQFPSKTLSNARSSGLMAMVKPGVWRPTYRGANFARGFGRGERAGRRSGARPTDFNDREGGETD